MTSKTLRKAVISSVISAAIAFSSVSPAMALDNGLPVIDPASTDISATTAKSGDTITATYRITDDNGCCSYNQAWLYSPSGTVGQQVSPVRISGDDLDGTYRATFTIPANAVGGNWTMKAQAYDLGVPGAATHLQLLGTVSVGAPVEVCGSYAPPAPTISSYDVTGYYTSSGTFTASWSPVSSAQQACSIVGYKITTPNGQSFETTSTSYSGTWLPYNSSSASFSIQAKTNSGYFGFASAISATRLPSLYWAPAAGTPSVTATAVSGTSITANWSHTTGAGTLGGYYVRAYNINGGLVSSTSVAAGTRTWTFANLSSNTYYSIRVIPFSTAQKEYTYASTTLYTLSGTPTVSASDVGINSAKLIWSTPSWVNVSRYSVIVGGVSRALASATATSLNLVGLNSGTSYPYTVTVYDSTGLSWQTTGSFQTQSVRNPSATIENITGYGATVRYNAPTSSFYEVTGVTVQYSLNNSTWLTAGTSTTATGTVELKNLPHGSVIYYRVQAATNVGIPASFASSFPTTAVPNPTTSVSGANGNSATGSWNLPSWVNINSIVVQLSSNNGASWVVVKTTTDKSGTVALSALRPGTAYQFRAVATLSDDSVKTGSANSFYTSSVTPPTVNLQSVDGVSASIAFSIQSFANSTGLFVSLNDAGVWKDISNTTSTSGTAQATGLTPGRSYTFRVTARLADGSSMSQDRAFTTSSLSAPTISLTSPTSSGVQVSFSLPSWSLPSDLRVQVSTNNGATWLNVANVSGTSGQTPISNLRSATYYYVRLIGTVNGQSVTSSNKAFTTTAIPNPTVVLTGLVGNNATVNWSLPSGVQVQNVKIESGIGGVFSEAGTSTSASGSYTFDGLKYGTTYTARVSIELPDGTVKVTLLPFTTVSLPSPTVTVSGVGATSGTVNWSLPSWVNVKEVDVQTLSNGTWTSAGTSTLSSGSETITGLKLGTATAVRLSITYDDGSTRVTNAPYITTLNPPTPGIKASAPGWSEVQVSWGYSFSELSKFELSWSTDSSNYGTPIEVDDSARSYLIKDLKERSVYYIALSAVLSDGTKRTAYTKVVTQVRPKVNPAAPEITNFAVSGRSASVSWTQREIPNAEEVTSWDVMIRSSDSSTWRNVDTVENVDGVELKLNISDLNPGRTYFAQIIARTATGLSMYSSTKVVLIKFPMGVPGNLGVSSTAFNGGVFNWYQPSDSLNEQPISYRLEFAVKGSEDFSTTKTVKAGSSRMSATVTELKSGVNYQWRVVAVGAGEKNETTSSLGFFSTQSAIKAPTSMFISQWGDTWAKIQWTQLNNAAYKKVDKFEIRVSKDEGKTWETLEAETTANTRIVTVEDLEAETEYEVRVVAISVDGDEAFTQIRVTTKQNLEAISEAKVSLTTARSAVILWTLPEDEEDASAIEKVSVQVQQKGKWISWTSNLSPDSERATLKGLKPNTKYTYRIVTTGDDGYSEYSSVRSFKTKR